GMAVVGAEQQAVCQRAAAILLVFAQSLTGPGQHIRQKAAAGTLPGAAAHLFIVEQAPDPTLAGGRSPQESPQGGPGAAQVVQTGAEQEFRLAAHGLTLVLAVELQVGAQNLRRRAARG